MGRSYTFRRQKRRQLSVPKMSRSGVAGRLNLCLRISAKNIMPARSTYDTSKFPAPKKSYEWVNGRVLMLSRAVFHYFAGASSGARLCERQRPRKGNVRGAEDTLHQIITFDEPHYQYDTRGRCTDTHTFAHHFVRQ